MKKLVLGAMVGIFALLFAGCSASVSAASARSELEQNAATTDSTVTALLDLADKEGLPVVGAQSRIDVCQTEPRPGLAYRAAFNIDVGTEPAARFDELAALLEADGWKRTDDDLGGTADTPSARFTRDEMVLTVHTGGSKQGTKRINADKMSVAIERTKECVRVPDGGYLTEVQDLKKDYLASR